MEQISFVRQNQLKSQANPSRVTNSVTKPGQTIYCWKPDPFNNSRKFINDCKVLGPNFHAFSSNELTSNIWPTVLVQ